MPKKKPAKAKRSPAKANVTHQNGDAITVIGVGEGATVAAGRGARASSGTSSSGTNPLIAWRKQTEALLDASMLLSDSEKQDAKEHIGKIEQEASKGSTAELERLSKLINTFQVMAPDIFDVAIATLVNPLLGFGLILKKVGDKVKLELTNKNPT